MVEDFDRAFLKKVKKVWPNTIYANTEITYHAVYSGGTSPVEGKLKFPLINIYRADGYELLPLQPFASRLQGYTAYTEDTEDKEAKGFQVRYLMARVAYQLNIFAKTLTELDKIANDILTMFSLDPKLVVTQYSANKEVKHTETFDITYLRGPIEQSTFNDDDRVYTYAVGYELSAAKLINFRETKHVGKVDVEVAVTDQEVLDKIEIGQEIEDNNNDD